MSPSSHPTAFFFFWTMLRSSLQLWQSWSCAKVVIVRQLDQNERSGTDNTKQTPTHTPKQQHQHQANNHQVPDQSMKRWNEVKQAHALTTSNQKKPRLSQRLQHLVVNDVNAQTLSSNRHCPLQSASIFIQGFLIASFKARAKKTWEALRATIVGSVSSSSKRSRSAWTGMSYSSTPASRHE